MVSSGLTPRFTCAGATDAVLSHGTPLPGVRCKRLLGPALARGPDPSPAHPVAQDARRGDGRGAGGPGQTVGAVTVVSLVSWPVVPVFCLACRACLGRLSSTVAVVVGPCRGVVVMPPCLGGLPRARRA